MRWRWPTERVLAVLAAASLEAAWLALLQLAAQWLGGTGTPAVDIGAFGLAAVAGLVLARSLRGLSRRAYAAWVVGAALAAALGAVALAPGSASVADALARDAAPWLLGIALLRGTAHAQLDDEAIVAERLLRLGIAGLVAFWVWATAVGLARDPAYAGPAFAASLTYVEAGLVALGVGRLADLRVEALDRAARRRWAVLLAAVTAIVAAVGAPLAALLGLPALTALIGIAGPLAPLLGYLLYLLALVVGSAFLSVAQLLPPSGAGPLPTPLPSTSPLGSPGPGVTPATGVTPDLAWLPWLIGGLVVAGVLVAVAASLRRPAAEVEPGREGVEVREPEPIRLAFAPRLPRLRARRAPGGPPRDAVEAYRLALAAMHGRETERRPGETPREHARRLAGTPVGGPLRRLVADYELGALAGTRLSGAEERRAIARWRSIVASLRRSGRRSR